MVGTSATSSQSPGSGAFTNRLDGFNRAISRGWRIVGTGLGFVAAGVISLFLALVAIPLVRIVSPRGERGEVRAQYAMHLGFRLHVAILVALGTMRVRGKGLERLREPGSLVVANHPTLIDALILMSFMPQADCVVKASHFDNFWLGPAVKAAGYIPNRDGPQLVEECAERLRRGRSVLIFPEGTRSPRGGLGEFARGAAHIALSAERDLLPVTIHCDPATLYRGLAWWDVPERRFTVTLTVDAPLLIDTAISGPTSRGRAARAVTASLRNHFERRLDLVPDQRTA
jgi:1-acyl-sn-glycerol-3-phosphate acyltransferase